MENYNFYRTDLLDESEEMVRHRTKTEKNRLKDAGGVALDESRLGRVILTSVTVDGEGEKTIGKKKGSYITLTIPTLTTDDREGLADMSNVLIDKLDEMTAEIPSIKTGKILLIGLGNRDVTPDAVGPMTMDRLRNIVPDYYSDEGGEVFVYAPGVTIQTGLETADFVKAVAAEIKPDLLIVVDALAARDSSRLCRTIQLTDTGIHPGSGVGNSRKEISKETLGMPVIAIGIPTVVDGPVLIADAIDTMFGYIASKINEKESPSSRLSVTPWLHTENKDADRSKLLPIFGDWASWPHEDRIQLFEEVLTSHELRTFISPKEIDSWVSLYADTLSESLTSWIANIKSSH
ncbi:GPR endopeptidase [Sporosarcina limicola]|uniref:Germination protease n=1 Tax=Sporosarcina limicola TaxID=34101 RepID=A0A927MHR8_9BACL|nr:GPR endopeptidase [Sporosarcina limicola]MBE1554650.1 spore protease [Sporosarcina limicola]